MKAENSVRDYSKMKDAKKRKMVPIKRKEIRGHRGETFGYVIVKMI
jgi:hypothetical protein